MKKSEKHLLKLYGELGEAERKSLLDFAEFLSSRDSTAEQPVVEVEKPKDIPRLEDESVVQAIKRLSASYHMLDKSKMLNETSVLMAEHTMQGRDRVEVIDDLEMVFQRHYERYVGDDSSE